jgi:hypothetical protein
MLSLGNFMLMLTKSEKVYDTRILNLTKYSSERKTVLNRISSEVFYEHFSEPYQNF